MKFIKNVSKPVSLKTLLLGEMTGYDAHRGLDEVHASDMTRSASFCPREYALHKKMGKAKKGTGVNASMRHTWDMGRDIEARVQNDYLRGFAVGDWKCTSCGDVRTFCKAPKAGCHREDINCNWRYAEVRLKHFPMTAGFDLLVDVGKPKLRLVEIKTIIKEEFEALKAPYQEHRARTIFYLKMIKESPLAKVVNTQVAHVLYVAKSFGKLDKKEKVFSPFKEYEIEYEEELAEGLWRKGKEYGDFLNSGVLPDKICPHGNTRRARFCAVRKECFSGV